MAWITPVTDRASGAARMTYADMNRIVGNINHLRNLAIEKGKTISLPPISKTSWIRDDIITTSQWYEILNLLLEIARAIDYVYPVEPDDKMNYLNINNVESISLTILALLEQSADDSLLNHWIGDGNDYPRQRIYSGDPVNAGGEYN